MYENNTNPNAFWMTVLLDAAPVKMAGFCEVKQMKRK